MSTKNAKAASDKLETVAVCVMSAAAGTIVAALIAAGAARGADLGRDTEGGYKDEPAAAVARSWTGVYLGASIGAGAAVHGVSASEWDSGKAVDLLSLDAGGQGLLGGAQVGADLQLGRVVIGAFADYDWSDIESKASLAPINVGYGAFGGAAKLTVQDEWSVGGRVGFLTTPDTLVYALAGYTQADGKIRVWGADGKAIDLGKANVDGSPSFGGWSVGGGLETRLAGNWFLKGEYRFSQFGDERVYADGNDKAGAAIDLSPDIHTVRAALTCRIPVGR